MSSGRTNFFSAQDSDSEQKVEVSADQSLAEVWSEKHQDHAFFQKGAPVRVAYEHLLHKLRYGQKGEVVGYADGEVCVRLEKLLAPVVMPAEILVSDEKTPKFQALKTFLRTSNKVNEDMLRVLGV